MSTWNQNLKSNEHEMCITFGILTTNMFGLLCISLKRTAWDSIQYDILTYNMDTINGCNCEFNRRQA